MAVAWSRLPSMARASVQEFKIDFSRADAHKLHHLVEASVVAPPTSWSDDPSSSRHGVTHQWMVEAQHYWAHDFSWERAQEKINRHPHFKTEVTDSMHNKYNIHFMALFSSRPDAIPIVFLHGWPGSFLEFMGLLDDAKSRYAPETSPYHFIVPSLPGFTLSSGMPAGAHLDVGGVAAMMGRLLFKIGLQNGYVVQGGDLGSLVAQAMGVFIPETRAVHVNFLVPSQRDLDQPIVIKDCDISLRDIVRGKGFKTWHAWHNAHAITAGTRPATLGFVLSSSPLALLAWVGEKMLAWSHPHGSLPLEDIITSVSLYWLTNTISRSLWPYVGVTADSYHMLYSPQGDRILVPLGYSRFEHDFAFTPEKWAGALGDLQFFRQHDDGGHFAAWERPEVLLDDVDEFVRQVFPNGLKASHLRSLRYDNPRLCENSRCFCWNPATVLETQAL